MCTAPRARIGPPGANHEHTVLARALYMHQIFMHHMCMNPTLTEAGMEKHQVLSGTATHMLGARVSPLYVLCVGV